MSELRIVMYHYVRDLKRTAYPAIKGRDRAEFIGQLDYIARHHTVVTAQEVIAASRGDCDLPSNAVWLTFDDGYIDHFTCVFPLLHERGWQGSFFVPARVVTERCVLDVNKIHFLMASQHGRVVNEIIASMRAYFAEYANSELDPFETYFHQHAVASRFDPPEVMFIKRMLQDQMPEPHRSRLLDQLFARFVSSDEAEFAAELYLSLANIRTMLDADMYFGSHGYNHVRLGRLEAAAQAVEVDRSLAFLQSVGAPTKDWVMCYPYGSHNDSVRTILRARSCSIGLTTVVDIARSGGDPLVMPRLDTNDLPLA